MFRDAVERARTDVVDAGYLAGLDAYRRGDYNRAVTELERTLSLEIGAQHQAALMRYYLGVSLSRLGRTDAAVRQLELAIVGDVAKGGVTDARYHLADALEKLGNLEEARVQYAKYSAAHPGAPLAMAARRKQNQLRWRIVQQGSAKAVPAAPKPKSAAGAAPKPSLPRPSPAPSATASPKPEPAAVTPGTPASPVGPDTAPTRGEP